MEIKWIPLKRRKPKNGQSVLVSDGQYVHEVAWYSTGPSAPDHISGYEYEMYLDNPPVYWASKPKAPKLNPADVPAVRKRRQRKNVKFGVNDCLGQEAGRMSEQMAKKITASGPWKDLVSRQEWPESMGACLNYPKK